MDKLKPCPFCGGEAQTLRIGSWWSIACRTPFCCDVGKCDTEAEAIEAWNTRAERTCKNTLPHNWGAFECSQCGGQYSVVPVYITAGGTPNDDPDPSCVNYCPNCGAKVIGGDAE